MGTSGRTTSLVVRPVAFLLSFLFFQSQSFGAPCCGGSALIPTLITGDEWAQISLGLDHTRVVSTANDRAITSSLKSDIREITQTANLQGAVLLFDQIQAGVSLPLVRRAYANPGGDSRGTGLGDLNFDVAYEILPELSYSPWRPKGFVYLKFSVPSGRSIFDGNYTESYGKGFYILSLGTTWVKSWNSTDALLSLEVHRTFGRTFSPPNGVTTRLGSSVGASGVAAVGWSPGRGMFRLGLSLSHIYDGGQTDLDFPLNPSYPQWSWAVGAQIGMVIDTDWSIVANVYDQSILQARNVAVNQGAGLLFQRRFEL